MVLAASDLKLYAAASMPIDDASTTGGVIDPTTRIVFDDPNTANMISGVPYFSSSLASDTQSFCVTGRDMAKAMMTQYTALNGTSATSGSPANSFSEIILCSGIHNGTVTVKAPGNVTILTMESGVNCVRKPFYNLQFTATGKTFYEKIFLKNTNSVDLLQDAWIIQQSDPSGKMSFAIASGQNDANTVANRLTAPVGNSISASGFSTAPKNLVPGTADLRAGSGIGIWLKTVLTGTESSFKALYTTQASGTIIT
jgi:hypothetical protein